MKRMSCRAMIAAFVVAVVAWVPSPAFSGDPDPIVFGITNSLGMMEGKESLEAITLAVEEINAKGGISVGGVKRKIKLEAMDTRSANPGVPITEALLGVEKMIMEKKAHVIVSGPWRSEASLAAMDLIAKYKVPMLINISQSPKIEAKVREDREKYKHTFRMGIGSDGFIGYMLSTMKYIKDQFGFDRVFIMVQDVLWAQAVAKIGGELLEKNGWKVVGVETFPTGAKDYSAAMLKASSGGAQVIFPAFDMHECGILVKQWTAMKIPALMVGVLTPVFGSEAWDNYQGSIAGLVNTFMEAGNMPTPKIPKSMEFYNAFKKRWGKELQSCHGPAPAYDGTYVVAEAIERANSLDGDAIAAALEKTDYQGAMGRVRFNDGHQVIFGNDPTEVALGGVFQWREGGERVLVFPESIAMGKILLPPNLKPAK